MQAPILIHGETGSGKELLARHAHKVSGRQGAFVAINCGALPAELFEAELFGYAGGAYTGARREGSAGLIASADGGTLLLDEVRELPAQVQASLLRFLDDRLVRPVGGTVARRIDVQLLAATHADLADEVAARRFRADLYFRLNTVRVDLPPLRRRSDFRAAVRHVLTQVDRHSAIDDEAVERLVRHDWPGNFRELRSVLTRALLSGGRQTLRAGDFEALLPAAAPTERRHAEEEPMPAGHGSTLQQVAAEAVRREFERTGRSVSQTSRNLGISRTTVYRHLGTAKT
jgi:transcriptional regulator with PAS, ATPase and Fis domain